MASARLGRLWVWGPLLLAVAAVFLGSLAALAATVARAEGPVYEVEEAPSSEGPEEPSSPGGGGSAGPSEEGSSSPTWSPPSGAPSEPTSEVEPCPAAALEPYEGEDAAAAEARRLRVAIGEECRSLGQRLDRLREREWTVVQLLAVAEGQRSEEVAELGLVRHALEQLVTDAESPAPVTVEGVGPGVSVPVSEEGAHAGTGEVVTAVEASALSIRSGLWFLVGAVVAGIVAYAIWRKGAIRG